MRALVENLAKRSALDPQYPDVTPRDAQALREWEACARRRSRGPSWRTQHEATRTAAMSGDR